MMAVSAVEDDKESFCLLSDVHLHIQPPAYDGNIALVKGSYLYYHYNCDDHQDQGWGCGYRTLQTLCSWIRGATSDKDQQLSCVPSITQIQQTLIKMKDKPLKFLGSRDWIGCFEACLIIDNLYNVSSKIVHVSSGSELRQHVETLLNHFTNIGSPIMMGGNLDCSSRAIMGIHISPNSTDLLVVDPHFCRQSSHPIKLASEGWVKWQRLDDFDESSFYNLCLPQLTHPSIALYL